MPKLQVRTYSVPQTLQSVMAAGPGMETEDEQGLKGYTTDRGWVSFRQLGDGTHIMIVNTFNKGGVDVAYVTATTLAMMAKLESECLTAGG